MAVTCKCKKDKGKKKEPPEHTKTEAVVCQQQERLCSLNIKTEWRKLKLPFKQHKLNEQKNLTHKKAPDQTAKTRQHLQPSYFIILFGLVGPPTCSSNSSNGYAHFTRPQRTKAGQGNSSDDGSPR